jgi:ubiquinone biosynthesis accessory factor UbiJ
MTTDSSDPGKRAREARSLGSDLLAQIERLLNRLIRESTAAADLLEDLQGSSFAVRIEGTGLEYLLRAEPERLTLGTHTGGATATLRAPPLDLLRLFGAASISDLRGTRAELTGDLQVAERFAALLKLARPDLEEELSRWIGDVPAHAFGEAVRGAGGWLRRAAAALRMNTAEYLQEESRVLPAPLEAQAFYADVERLRDAVERAAARLARLERR